MNRDMNRDRDRDRDSDQDHAREGPEGDPRAGADAASGRSPGNAHPRSAPDGGQDPAQTAAPRTTGDQLPRVLARREVARSRLFRIEELDLQFSNGVRRIYERLPATGHRAVMVVAITDDDRIVLIREYMAGFHEYQLTLPKGAADAGESLEEAADRELKEEAGFGARRIETLKELSVAPGHMGFTQTAMLAQGLYAERLPGDEPEPLEVETWPLADLDALFGRPDFNEARAIAALHLAALRLKELRGTSAPSSVSPASPTAGPDGEA